MTDRYESMKIDEAVSILCEDLIERLRSVNWEVTDDGDRMPDDPTRECVFVDMRPDEFEALLRETAAALEAAREDAERLDALEALVDEQPDKALLLHHGLHKRSEQKHACLSLSNTTLRQSIDAAIDQARGKGVA